MFACVRLKNVDIIFEGAAGLLEGREGAQSLNKGSFVFSCRRGGRRTVSVGTPNVTATGLQTVLP